MLSSLLLSALVASFATAAPSLDFYERSSMPPANGTNTSFVSAAWIGGWEVTNSTFSAINWEKYSMISWSFALTTPDPSKLSLDASGPSFIPDFVKQAQEHQTMALLTVGGWTGSRYFSSAVNPQNRSMFVQAVLDTVKQYGFDGVEFDWEYPALGGIGCNENSSSDASNFLAFLQELRQQPEGQKLYISAAAAPTPFVGPDGKPMTNVSDFAAVLDHLTIMNYDVNGQWSTTDGVSPNAPLDDSCSKVQTGSATKAFKAWTNASFPASQILLGVPAYGHSYNVSSTSATDSSGNLVDHPPFTQAPPAGSVDLCGNPELVVDTLTFAGMIAQGLLNDDGTPANGMKYRFDNCSQTPFLYDPTKQLMVSYDDPTSFAAKGNFIVENNLLGFAMWELISDHNDLLVDAIEKAVGIDDCS